jgi:hypothetical protein
MTTSIPTLLRHRSFLATGLDYSEGTLMHLSGLLAWHRSCVNRSSCVSLLSLASCCLGNCARGPAAHNVLFMSSLISPTLCLTNLSYHPSTGRHTLSQPQTKLHRSGQRSSFRPRYPVVPGISHRHLPYLSLHASILSFRSSAAQHTRVSERS